jgi:fumarate hydratase class II
MIANHLAYGTTQVTALTPIIGYDAAVCLSQAIVDNEWTLAEAIRKLGIRDRSGSALQPEVWQDTLAMTHFSSASETL